MAETTIAKNERDEEQRDVTREPERYLTPAVDIYETEEGLTVLADMPGVDKEDVDVRVDDNILTLRGKCTHGLGGDPLKEEFALSEYYRQFELGETVDQEKIEAGLSRGVLKVHLPRAEKAKPRQIPVQVN